MVSTPIPPSSVANLPPPPPPPPFIQSGQHPYLYHPKNQGHTFPVLYSSPVITTSGPTEVQPVSLYSEYMGNPYESTENVNKSDVVDNSNNVFQSSNYFGGESTSDFIPPGSEILYGTETSNFTIPVCVNNDSNK